LKFDSVSILVTSINKGDGKGTESMDLKMQDWLYNGFGKIVEGGAYWTEGSSSES